MRSYRTPEEAALGDVPARFVRVIGTVVRGDQAVVAQLMNDRPPFEIETTHCVRVRKGLRRGWEQTGGGNSSLAFMATGPVKGTVVVWGQAPEFAAAARFEHIDRELVVPVENGCVLAVFDDVDGDEVLPDSTPKLSAWIEASGTEHRLPHSPDYHPKLIVRARAESGISLVREDQSRD
jgi:hypothetical protein